MPTGWWRFLALVLGAVTCLASAVARSQDKIDWTIDLILQPEKVLGHEACAKCHAAEFDVWKRTPHFDTFHTLHRRPEAKLIAERLGISSIKRDPICLRCHFTPQQQPLGTRPVAGVSCESCHGAARDWLDVHHDYGGPDVAREQESEAHRRQRREESISRGMRNPTNLYLIARSCLNCHTVPHERLVNVGGHPAGSQDFELVAWSQGKVRHNFVRSDGKFNEPSSRERLRVMYVVGLLADLEYSLRATSLATEKAPFGTTSARRARAKLRQLADLQQLVNHPLLQQAVDAAAKSELRLDNRQQLLIAADEVGAAAYAFAESADGQTLEAVDRFLPTPTQYKQ